MKVNKPNAVIYFLVYIFLMPFMKIFFRLEINRDNYNRPDSSFLVLCNHGSFMDFVIAMLSIYPLRLNAVTAQKYFFYSPLHKFLPMMGCIPKNLFDADIRSIIGIKQVLAGGGSVLLFPEGRAQTDGMYAGINTATGKLIKKLQVPVVACSIDGAYDCMPFWRDGIRHGRIRITVSNLFSADSLRSLSVDDINKAIDRRLAHEDDPEPIRRLGAYSKKRLAQGLEQILYLCPMCKAEFKTFTCGCTISCGACGYTAQLDGQMNLITLKTSFDNSSAAAQKDSPPGSVHGWFKMQVRYEAGKLSDDMAPIVIDADVRLPSKIPGGGMRTCGSGTASMDTSGWHFDGVINNGQANLHFPFNVVPAIPFDPDDVFQIYAHGTFYCFAPKFPRASVKYSIIGECAYLKFAPEIRMTPGMAFRDLY